MPPKKSPNVAKKAAASAAQKKVDPSEKKSLITSTTSPVIIKKAFGNLTKLFRALIQDMDQPLPPRVKPENITREGFQALSKRLSTGVTKYVLFVCQEGTLSTIESQTQVLLNIIRSVCVAIRGKLKDSGLTLQISLAENGTTLLELLITLLNDLSSQISTEWKKCLDANGKFQSPLNSDDTQIVQITARIWAACEKLGTMPLTDVEAAIVQGGNYLSMMKDALVEIKAIKEGDYEFPKEEEEEEGEEEREQKQEGEKGEENVENVENVEKIPQRIETTPDAEIVADAPNPEGNTPAVTENEQNNPNGEETKDAQTLLTDQFDDTDLDFNQNEVSQSEYAWIQHGKEIISFANGIISTFITKILPNMKHPNIVGDIIDLKIPGSLNQQKQFVITLERRLKDVEKITYYVDMLCNHLYSPQNVPQASKYAFFIVSKIARLLLWLDIYHKNNWFKHILDTPEGGMVFVSEKKDGTDDVGQNCTKCTECTEKELDKCFVQHFWGNDMIINPALRPIVVAKNNEYVSKNKMNMQFNRIHEFDDVLKTHKLNLISDWKFLNFQRKELFLIIYSSKHKDKKNIFLEYLKLKFYKFPIPANLTQNVDTALLRRNPIYTYTEDDLFDDREDLAPDDDDGDDNDDEDWDEDDLYDDDYGLFSDSD
jgi:hypothetical protein